MRWRFPEPSALRENARRASIISAVDAWWGAFAAAAPAIALTFARQASIDIAGFMQTHLSRVDSRLMWEFGPALRGSGHRLVITPETERHLRPLVDVLLARVPELPGWEFYPYRLSETFDRAVHTVRGRTGADITAFQVTAARGDLHLIDLTWRLPPNTATDDRARGAAFVATESLLGEEVLDTWIGTIRVEASGGELEEGLPESLRERVSAMVADIQEGLPKEPHTMIDESSGATLFHLKPAAADDYPDRLDLLVSGSRGLSEMWQAAHSAIPFSSRRYSQHRETFCYLKIDGMDGLENSSFEDRGDIEDALDDMLRKTALGAVVGGGTGLRYSYVDLMLLHLDHGLAEVRRLAREGGLPHRSWLLFFDATLQAEWVGIYESTPPPPRLADRDD